MRIDFKKMKFPTFMKNQNKDCKSSKSRKTVNASLAAGQLLLTDSFQPQKKLERTPKDSKLPSPLTNLVNVKNTPTTIGTLSKVSNKKFECLIDSFTPQQLSLNSSRCGSISRVGNAKRLQRNRGLVKSKPASFLVKPAINQPFRREPSICAETHFQPETPKTTTTLNQPVFFLIRIFDSLRLSDKKSRSCKYLQ